jgi:hypothetical protein
MLYLDLYSNHPQLEVNENYFRLLPPPHLQQSWKGNVYGDSTVYNVSLWDNKNGAIYSGSLNSFRDEPVVSISDALTLSFRSPSGDHIYDRLYLVNTSTTPLTVTYCEGTVTLKVNDSIGLNNPCHVHIHDEPTQGDQVLIIEPQAYMKNYYVNGSRFYAYPLSNRFTWARNFAEAISSSYADAGLTDKNAFVSFDMALMDSISQKIKSRIGGDTAYKTGAEYAVCIADGNGRLVAMTDFIKGLDRPDPNDKVAFNRVIQGEDGTVTQSLLRKQIGNVNLLRMNPGPGSTLKPIVFSSIASQMNFDWNAFQSTGFSGKQKYFGGEKVAEYDFEKDNGTINNVTDYLRYSDNYYHSNVLLLGSFPKQNTQLLLDEHFSKIKTDSGFHWPYFRYHGTSYWLDGFENWPGYKNGKADMGAENSFVSIGMLNNFGISVAAAQKSFDKFSAPYDSLLFLDAQRKSGFLLPEYALFDQQANHIDHRIPYDIFAMSFRGHVKGSSQVMIPPVKMLDAFGKLITQNKDYRLTLNPYARELPFSAFDVDSSISYNSYLSIMRENVFTGMREALFRGTAARLGTFLKDGSPWYYYAKTGTTGDDELKTKSKLFAIIISSKDITDPDFNFRDNRFYIVYFTSQNGPAKQNEEFQAEVIRLILQSASFNRYMKGKIQ